MYIKRNDKQEASKSDLERALNDLIDEFSLTPSDRRKIIKILNDNNISFEK